MKRQLLFLLFLVVLCSGMAFGQIKVTFYYKLTVAASTPALQGFVYKSVLNQLKANPDLELRPGAGYTLDVMAVEVLDPKTRVPTYLFSVVLSSSHTCSSGVAGDKGVLLEVLSEHHLLATPTLNFPTDGAAQIAAILNTDVAKWRKAAEKVDTTKLFKN